MSFKEVVDPFNDAPRKAPLTELEVPHKRLVVFGGLICCS